MSKPKFHSSEWFERSPVKTIAVVESGFAFQILPLYHDLVESDEHEFCLSVLQKREFADQDIWQQKSVHLITDKRVIDDYRRVGDDEEMPFFGIGDPLQKVELRAGPFTVIADEGQFGYTVDSVRFEINEHGIPTTDEIELRVNSEQEEAFRRERESFRKSFKIDDDGHVHPRGI